MKSKFGQLGVVLFMLPTLSYALPKEKEAISLSRLEGMTEYCQDYYQSTNDLDKHATMFIFKTQISEKAASLFTSTQEADNGHKIKLEAYSQYQNNFSDNAEQTCKNLAGTLKLLKL
ncbi:hypothetical protein [Vibrio crassostreae]|uniref:hypothetical protein n=1 Tax=Vibrio crassostreae TaxID=246167 RepID=UPI00105137D1|nr:hypothetical protein [Vibrio crassostreae]TCV20617.1 hypothetical protein EDB11_115103 [Vibrio crassostreae]CAK1766170.1 conserved hypothetical protein [Vibrio crassostreae]